MDGLVDKIVEKYSEDLLRLFPLQKLFATLMVTLIFCMVKHGAYISALESVFHLSLKDLFGSDGELLKITLGTLFFSLGLSTIVSFIQGKSAEKVLRFIAKGADIEKLSNTLHEASAREELPMDIVTVLASECSERLQRKKANMSKLSSLAEFMFILGFAEIAAAVYGINLIDLLFSIAFILIWFVIRGWLVFRFIREILPLEAHFFGIRGVPYELNMEQSSL